MEWPAYEVTGIAFGRRDVESGPVQGPAAMTTLSQRRVKAVLSAQATRTPVILPLSIERDEALPRTKVTPFDMALSRRETVNKYGSLT
jgi:hypothetical protein